jgi:hypothetical protein
MLEAAEALGVLAGAASTPGDAGDDADDDDGTASSKSRKSRKVRLDAVVSDAIDVIRDRGGAGRKKSTSSSYWSVPEKNEFIRLLGIHGKDFKVIASYLNQKTAVQCRNVRSSFSPVLR